MPTIWFFDEHGSKLPEGQRASDFGRSLNAGLISADDGLPINVHSITIRHGIYSRANRTRAGAVDHTTLDYTTLRTLLENTPRKLGKIHFGASEQARLIPEYLDCFASICAKAESLHTGALSHVAEIECLATRLAQSNGPAELYIDFHAFGAPNKILCLQEFFRSIGPSSLTTLVMRNIYDLSSVYDFGNLLSEALEVNQTIKKLELQGDWGHENRMMVERVICVILERTQVEDLMVFSRFSRPSSVEKTLPYSETTRSFFEKLASARHLRNLELNHNLLIESDYYLNSFEDAICRNRYLERLHIRYPDRGNDRRKFRWPERYDEKFCFPLSVNRASRGLDHSTPPGLWPYVLERAGKIRYYSAGKLSLRSRRLLPADDWKSPSSEHPRVDVVYKLLRERVLLR